MMREHYLHEKMSLASNKPFIYRFKAVSLKILDKNEFFISPYVINWSTAA